jgi:predicted transcriptional regulator
MDKRDKFEIIADILTVVDKEGPLYKTSIAGKSNLDSRMLEKYIDIMLDAGLIAKVKDEPRLFTITDKGRYYLNLYRSIRSMLLHYRFNIY